MNDIELALRALGLRLDVGDGRDLVDAVLAGIESHAAAPRLRTRRRLALLVAVAALLLAAGALAASPALRADVRSWLGRDRIEVTASTALPPATKAVSLATLGLGVPTDAAEAAARLGLAALPSTFGPPDAVAVAAGPVVTAVWLPGHGLPGVRAVPAVGALLTMLPLAPMVDPMILGKVLAGGSVVEFVEVPGAAEGQAVWIAGAPHAVTLFDGSSLRFRLAANVLVWRVGEVVYRLESALGRAAAIAAAVRGIDAAR